LKGRPMILVLREDCDFSRELRKHGYEVLNLSLIATRPLADLTRLRELLGEVGRFDAIFITSRAAATVLTDELKRREPVALPLVYVLGGRAKKVLAECGIAVEYRESANTAAELLDELGESGFAGKSILFLRGDRSLRTIPERLGKVATVEEAVVYETVAVPIENEEAVGRLQSGQVDWLCFFSPSAVESYSDRGFPLGVKAAAIGETTAARARSLGFSVDFVSERTSPIKFAKGLARYIESFE
jgi:uroporphyrinogen-III synthase